ncbi:hypothetical protein HU200_045861 [Digitaria exilis]|uniref:Histone-lysine N-methyltransferase SUVR4 n=1 Tax=Digitaria exilis TaxID=1010633 RepID=A0A835EE31_9POAL|nr:hypothetical protein HU200_045861 [Digitaria exilis]
MVSRSNKERARAALDAMKVLGFSKKEATPVLKTLLKLFDNSWEPIEDECYRALADAILDARDCPQGAEHGSHGARMVAPEEDRHQPSTSLVVHRGPCGSDSETEAPLIKRPRTNPEEDGHQPSISLVVHGGPCDFETEAPLIRRPRTNSNNLSADHSIGPELFPSSSNTAHNRAKQMIDEDFQHAVFLREPKLEPDMDATQSFHDAQVGIVSHPFNTSPSGAADPHPLEVHLPNKNQSVISGDKGRPILHRRTRTSSASFAEPTENMEQQPQNRESLSNHAAVMHNTETGSADEHTQETPNLHTVVASSTMGEVKMSIKCSVDTSKFRMPSLEAVFSMVEDKWFRSDTGLPPKFSIGSLMNEICQCIAQVGNDHAAECSVQSKSFDNGRNSQKECMNGAAPVESIASMNSGGGKYKSVEDSLILETSEIGQTNSMVAQHLALPQLRRTTHDASDISKGEEKVRISVVNEFGSEKFPPSFYYIQRNLVSQKASANISCARTGDEDGCADCFGNCLSAPMPCSCAKETGGEFAYTQDGLLRTAFLDECFFANLFPEKHHKFFCKPLKRPRDEAPPEPSKGRLVRKFIKECGSKCGCNMQCGNRVVQRGIACKLQVFLTQEGKGWGLRTLDELPKGTFICEYVGELLTNMELCERASEKALKAGNMYPVDLDADRRSDGVLKDQEVLCLDTTCYGNVARFINHRCYDANLVEIPVEMETPDYHYYHDYGINFDDDKNPGRAFQCLCGSRYCRGRKRWRNRGKAAAKLAVVEGTRG